MKKHSTRSVVVFCSLVFSTAFIPLNAYATRFGADLCQESGYTCKEITKYQSWESLWPNDTMRDIVMRINRTNEELHRGEIIAVPDALSFSSQANDFSPFAQQINTNGEKEIIVDPHKEAYAAYDANGDLVRWGPVSTGSNYCRDLGKRCHTPVGSFRIFDKEGEGCVSTRFPLPYGGAPMPYCMHFFRGFALHGEPNGEGLPGYNASHGCVRMFIDDAEWLNHEFIDLPGNHHGGTRVIVKPY